MCINTAAKRNAPLFITHSYKRGGIRDGPMLGRASPFVLLTDGTDSGYVLHLHGALRFVGRKKKKMLSEAGLSQQVRGEELGSGGEMFNAQVLFNTHPHTHTFPNLNMEQGF